MFIKCWGSRGSIPVSGKEYQKYGGDTTCLEIRTRNDDIIIVDAGTGIRRLGNDLIQEQRFKYNFVITHGHWDHLMGFPFFKPIYDERSEFIIQSCPFPKPYVEKMFSRVMTPPNFPVRYSDVKANIIQAKDCVAEFEIGSTTVIPFPLSHPNTGNGYKFIENGKTFVFVTDNELAFVHPGGRPYADYVNFCRGADLLFHDGEYTPAEYESTVQWGHSTYLQALELALDAGVRRLGLFHLNQDRTDQQMDDIVLECRAIIAERKSRLTCFAVASDMTFRL